MIQDIKNIIFYKTIISWLLLLSVLQGCENQDQPVNTIAATSELNLYSSRHYDTDLALYENFTEQTGIQINRIEAKADALIERIDSEGSLSPADVLMTVDAGRLWRAEQRNILRPISSDIIEMKIPKNLRHPDGLWVGLSTRARVIIYNKAAGMPDNLADYADLGHPSHKGKVCIRSSSNIYNISLMASIIAHEGEEAAQSWAEAVVSNFARKPQGNDTAQIKAVAAGECEIALVNSYYLARFAGSKNLEDQSIFNALGIIFPNQDNRGTHINISGAAIVKHAPNYDNAMKFIEYLTQAEAQGYFANGNNEYPVVNEIAGSSAVQSLGTFEPDHLNVQALGQYQAAAIHVFDKAGWQ